MGTAGGVTNFAGLYGKRHGLMQQVVHGVASDLLSRIDALGGLNAPQDGMAGRIRVRSYDVSAYKCAADQLMLARGVELLFHAYGSAVAMSPDGKRIEALIVETKSGRQAIRAKRFIDCSGDADMAHFAGAPYPIFVTWHNKAAVFELLRRCPKDTAQTSVRCVPPGLADSPKTS